MKKTKGKERDGPKGKRVPDYVWCREREQRISSVVCISGRRRKCKGCKYKNVDLYFLLGGDGDGKRQEER